MRSCRTGTANHCTARPLNALQRAVVVLAGKTTALKQASIYIGRLFQNAMELMGIVGVMVNCALIGQSGQVHRMFPNITGTQTVLLIIILEVSYLHMYTYTYVLIRR